MPCPGPDLHLEGLIIIDANQHVTEPEVATVEAGFGGFVALFKFERVHGLSNLPGGLGLVASEEGIDALTPMPRVS